MIVDRHNLRGYDSDMGKAGRPSLHAKDRRSRKLFVRATPAEHRRLQAEARAAGVTLSAWMRTKLLRGQP